MITRLLAFALTVLAAAISVAQSPLPAPTDLSLASPASSLPQNLAAFAGAWKGAWGGSLPSALVVEQIDPTGKAQVIYSWGDASAMNIKAGWSRMTGQITNSTLHLSSDANGPTIDFDLETNGDLFGKYEIAGQSSFVEMERIPSRDQATIVASASQPSNPWKEIWIPEHSQVGPTAGKLLMLQTSVYPVARPGKHPVVIFNHGSTGPGLIPANYVFRGGAEATLFHSLGYIEVVPMRKGRGASDGPYLEENDSVPIPVGLDSAMEDLHTVVEYVSRMPDVDPARIVVAGVSRGGLLSVAYAGRYPTNIVGVINFSGGWFSEGMPGPDYNFQFFREAGHNTSLPMLWLYADTDSLYSFKYIQSEFDAFRTVGGTGDLVEVKNVPGEGHLMVLHMDLWRDNVANYLQKIK